MARSYGRVKVEVWSDDDWRGLSGSAQRLYMLLLSQPSITNCGLLPYAPKRWARLCSDTAVADVEAFADELENARFVVIDGGTDELLVRTFIKHDCIVKQPNLKRAAKKEFLVAIESAQIREVLRAEYPQLFSDEALNQAESEDLREDLSEGHSEDLPERVRKEDAAPLLEGVRLRRRDKGSTSTNEEIAPHLHATVDAVVGALRQIPKAGYTTKLRIPAVAAAIEKYPDRDHLEEALRLADWERYGGGSKKERRDGAATYRNWLSRSQPVQNAERVDLSAYDRGTIVV